jgi:hypothetical protein
MEALHQELKKLHSVGEVCDILNHCVGCPDCNKAYDDWYYSSKNLNYERYMKDDRQFKAKVEERRET